MSNYPRCAYCRAREGERHQPGCPAIRIQANGSRDPFNDMTAQERHESMIQDMRSDRDRMPWKWIQDNLAPGRIKPLPNPYPMEMPEGTYFGTVEDVKVHDDHIDATLRVQSSKIVLRLNDDTGKEIGGFIYDKDTKTWSFDGNMDNSAKQFARILYAHFQSILDGDRDGITTAKIYVDEGIEERCAVKEKVWPEKTPLRPDY